jgi:hypothetical protein
VGNRRAWARGLRAANLPTAAGGPIILVIGASTRGFKLRYCRELRSHLNVGPLFQPVIAIPQVGGLHHRYTRAAWDNQLLRRFIGTQRIRLSGVFTRSNGQIPCSGACRHEPPRLSLTPMPPHPCHRPSRSPRMEYFGCTGQNGRDSWVDAAILGGHATWSMGVLGNDWA